MRVTSRDLLSLADRLEAREDPKSIAAELRRMARRPGRPKERPLERGLRKLKSLEMANAIFEGTLPESEYPPEFALAVKRATGKRTEADAMAATILGKGHSVRSIQKARERRPMDQTVWEEFKALVLFSAARPASNPA
jgi:hypothetical protein